MLTRLDALAVGVAAWRCGAGRSRKEQPVQAGAGVILHAKPGDTVTAGQPLMTLLSDDPSRFRRAEESLADAVDIVAAGQESAGQAALGSRPDLVLGRIG